MAKPVIDAHSIVYIQGKKLQKGSYRRIRSRIERMIAKEPRIDLYLELAYLEARKQYWDRAQVAVESALQIEDSHRDAQLFLAQILEARQEITQAKQTYQAILDQYPDYSQALREYGRFLMHNTDEKKWAQAILLKALEMNPKDPMAHILLAEIFVHNNREAQALLHLEIAERYQDCEPLSHEHMARLWMKMQQYDKAIRQWKAALKYFPRNKLYRLQFRQAVKAQQQNRTNRTKSFMFWKKWGFK
jgi:Tfp pilus assembly protein PilF